jgi:tripartite ATP-independent transporter DctP family solute receptor
MTPRKSRRGTASLLALLGALAVLATACGDGAGGGGTKVRLAIADPASSSVGKAAEHFAEQVDKTSGGKVDVQVYPDGTLFGGDQNAAVNQLQGGSLDVALLSTSVYASFEEEMNAISLPYLFEDTQQLRKYLEAEPGQDLMKTLEQRMGIKGLALMTRTLRHVTNSKRPIETPQDLDGLKLRVPNNEMWVKYFRSLGANPTPLDFSEVYTAMQLGVIDGQENPVEVPVANKFDEVQKYLSMTGHIADAYVLGINKKKWEGYDAATQKALLDAARETAAWKADYDDKEAAKQVDELASKGMKVNELSDAELAPFREKARALYPTLKDAAGGKFVDQTLQWVGRQ